MPRAHRLSPGGVKLLQEKQIAILATTMRDGSPQATPVWVDVEPDGSHILINTAEGHQDEQHCTRPAGCSHRGGFGEPVSNRGDAGKDRRATRPRSGRKR